MLNVSKPVCALWGAVGVYLACGYLFASSEVRFGIGTGTLSPPLNMFNHSSGHCRVLVVLFLTEYL